MEMHLQHRVMQPGFEGEDAFISGRSGMTLSGPWVEAFFSFPFEFDFAAIPRGPSANALFDPGVDQLPGDPGDHLRPRAPCGDTSRGNGQRGCQV